jgi:hypothetical protein
MTEEIKELSLKEKVDMLLSQTEEPVEENKNKSWNIPWLTKFKSNVGKKKIEKGWATFIILKTNRNLEFTRAQVKEGIAILDGFPRVSTSDEVFFYKRKPFYLLREGSMKCISLNELISEDEKYKMSMAGRRAVLATLETEKIKSKKDFGNWAWVILGLIVIGAGYYYGTTQGWF